MVTQVDDTLLKGAPFGTLKSAGIQFGDGIVTEIAWTGLPSGMSEVYLILDDWRQIGSNSLPAIQMGSAAGGYSGAAYSGSATTFVNTTLKVANHFNGFYLRGLAWTDNGERDYGVIHLVRMDPVNHIWSCTGILGRNDSNDNSLTAGGKTLNAGNELDRIRIFQTGTVHASTSAELLYR